MQNCAIFQIHIPKVDKISLIDYRDKLKFLELNITHFKKSNPNCYLILSGHGIRPRKETMNKFDYIYWEDKLREIDKHGFVIDMPAQHFFISKALDHAKDIGFNYCLKTRGDCLILKKDIISESHKILKKEKKKLLITQNTTISDCRLGDCFMYGEIDLLKTIWGNDIKNMNQDGEINCGIKFLFHFTNNKEHFFDKENLMQTCNKSWKKMIIKNCSFRNVFWIGYIDMRREMYPKRFYYYLPYFLRNLLSRNFESLIYDDSKKYKYLWGRKNKWFRFNKSGFLEDIPTRNFFFEDNFYK